MSALTKREKEVAQLVSEGLINKEIAQRLDITVYTVKNHLHNIYRKLKIENRNQLAISIYKTKPKGAK